MVQATKRRAGAPPPPEDGPADDRAEALAAALVGVVGALKRSIGDPETNARSMLLAHVARLAPVRASDLACHAHLDGSTISRHLRVLEEAGLLERSPDPDDRRAALLDLTDSGRAELDRVHLARTALFAGATATWSDRDVADLTRLLQRMTHDLETL